MEIVIAGLTFLSIVTLIVGAWWFVEARRRLSDRLKVAQPTGPEILRAAPDAQRSKSEALLRRTRFFEQLNNLLRQAGREESATKWAYVIAVFALVGGVLGWLRTGGAAAGLLVALFTGSLPLFYLVRKRHQRLKRFQAQFPDALDTMARALRTGYALGGAIQLVGDEMPDPVGQEFKRVFEEIRLGLDPTEALVRLRQRISTEDMNFFCSAIMIQRSTGGNLTEILDHLSEVIRERFKLLSHIRAISAQHKWSAICVGLSPVVFAMMFQLISPHYFDPLWSSPLAPLLLGGGVVMEAIGFFMVWRIAKIEV
ncbi:MAG TPA: type II secretion system F family protein [Methylomirabilota bacterium]|nr:type II secretion system F family protein [Methylomirabilota bacterium]